MGYVEKQLVRGEHVIFETRLHWMALVGPWLIWTMLVFLGGLVLANDPESSSKCGLLCCFFAPLGAIPFTLPAYINFTTSEFALTNRRVIIKTGWISRNTLELNLGRIESFQVCYTLLGRLFGYNNLLLTGSGGTHQEFKYVRRGAEFRRMVVEYSTEI